MKYYVDTCVWIDFVEGEKYAEDFFIGVIAKEDIILTSNLVFKEYIKHMKYSDIHVILSMLKSKNLLIYIHASSDQDLEAKVLSEKRNIPYGDAFHAVLTRDKNATLVSRDKHFLSVKDICRIKLF